MRRGLTALLTLGILAGTALVLYGGWISADDPGSSRVPLDLPGYVLIIAGLVVLGGSARLLEELE